MGNEHRLAIGQAPRRPSRRARKIVPAPVRAASPSDHRQHYSNRLTAAMAQQSLRILSVLTICRSPPSSRGPIGVVVNEKDKAGLDANLAMQQEWALTFGLVWPGARRYRSERPSGRG